MPDNFKEQLLTPFCIEKNGGLEDESPAKVTTCKQQVGGLICLQNSSRYASGPLRRSPVCDSSHLNRLPTPFSSSAQVKLSGEGGELWVPSQLSEQVIWSIILQLVCAGNEEKVPPSHEARGLEDHRALPVLAGVVTYTCHFVLKLQ